ncbi:MAG: zinc ribbon domain-containing protein [Armatimonadetes bacterium]|nr:zinc ribbon domain-containing protein [Armatimonadota bacterium]
MPIYEYRCRDCQKKFSTLVGVVAGTEEVICPNCKSAKVAKLVSKFARYRSEDDRIDAIADQLEFMDEPDSGAEMRSLMREMGKATDDDVSDEMEAMFEADMEGKGDDE